MNWIEQKYIGLISNRLRNYKRKSGNMYNFSCPFCGDSTTDLRKARGYLYTKSDKVIYYCHNCNITYSFSNFLKNLDYHVFSEFLIENMKESSNTKEFDELQDFTSKMKQPVFIKSGPLKGLKKISQLKSDHPCKVFIDNRKIPNIYHSKLFYSPKFFSWVNEIIPEKFADNVLNYDEARLVIPFINKNDVMHAFQGRSLKSESKTRYITIVNDDKHPKVWGLDKVDFSKRVYVLEGPIDAMFLPNAIATAGGDLVATIHTMPKENIVVVYDNEKHSKETVGKIQKAIYNGYSVCIWPDNFEQKDVNDAILTGLSSQFIQHIIDNNTFKDLRALCRLNFWKKV
jgi:hypothetical protein